VRVGTVGTAHSEAGPRGVGFVVCRSAPQRATAPDSDGVVAGMARSYSPDQIAGSDLGRTKCACRAGNRMLPVNCEGAPRTTKSADKRWRLAPRSSCPRYQENRPVPFVGLACFIS